ncbi:hypothetical protein FACS189446_8400 [Bacteroidia bacterium]|nr:hypothetical protein FACS189446_8400 [Bacteroidia bacterium]
MEIHKILSLFEQKEFLLNSSPVTILTGNEFSKKEGMTLTQQVIEYYHSLGGKIISPVYGEIILDKQSVEDDFAHGVGRKKAIAFAAVPDVIEKGIVILPLGHHKKDEKTVSAMIAAPIIINADEYACVVVIRQYASGNKKLYVHEVSLKHKLLDNSSNPALIPATNQGNIAKILQKIISAKFN